MIHDVVSNDYQRMEYLRMYVSENVRAEIAGLLSEPSQYQEALQALANQYEDRVLLGKTITRKLSELPNVRSGDVKALDAYLLRLNEIIATMHRVKLVGEMFSPSVLEIAMGKLTNEMTEAWGEKIIREREEMSLASLKEWLDLKRKARALTQPSASTSAGNCSKFEIEGDLRNTIRGREELRRTRIHVLQSQQSECPICQGRHKIQECESFLSAAPTRRYELVKEHRLCFGCLRKGHGLKMCRSKKSCGKEGCTKIHHPDLHESAIRRVNYQHGSSENRPTVDTEVKARINVFKSGGINVALGIISVPVKDSRGRLVTARTLIDEGSDTTLAARSFVRKLGFNGRKGLLKVVEVNGESREQSERLNLTIRTAEDQSHTIHVWALNQLCEAVTPVDWNEVQGRCPHLAGIQLGTPPGPIDLLIGMDHAELLMPKEMRTGGEREPYAIRTKLGWVARGIMREGEGPRSHRIHVLAVEESTLDREFKRFWDTEKFGTEGAESKKKVLSEEDMKASEIVRTGTRPLNPGYEVPLPWKKNPPQFENNKQVAMQRLSGLLKKFAKEPEYETAYRTAVQKYIDDGYALPIIAKHELDHPRQWFLPYHGVYKKSAE